VVAFKQQPQPVGVACFYFQHQSNVGGRFQWMGWLGS
jgi:hypothetical protein